MRAKENRGMFINGRAKERREPPYDKWFEFVWYINHLISYHISKCDKASVLTFIIR